MMFLLLIIFIISLLYYIHWKSERYFNRYFKNMPGPVGIPFLGTGYHYLLDDVRRNQTRTLDWFKKYGDTFLIYCSWQYVIVTSDPKTIEDLLTATNKNLDKNYLYSLLRPWLMEGLLLSTGSKWHNRRKIITPAFHFKNLENFIPIFEEQGDILVEKIKKLNLKEDEAFDIHEFIALMTLDAIAETSMGIKPLAQTQSDCVYTHAVREISEIISIRNAQIYWKIDLLCFLLKHSLWKAYRVFLKILHNFTEKTIIDRRELLKSELNRTDWNQDTNDYGQKQRMVLLDILLRTTINGLPLTNLDIREEVDTFMFEGHDTTTAGICFTLYLISRHQEVQKKIYNEILEVLGNDKNKTIGYRELQDMKYLELVIKESLRMYPPVGAIGRVITEDSILGGVLYPKDTDIVIHLQKAMRNSKIFENPDDFIPERHISCEYLKLNPFSYIPFSGGPRNCIGQKYAILELKSVVTNVIRNFELLPNGKEVDPLIGIILKSTTGFHMGFKVRK